MMQRLIHTVIAVGSMMGCAVAGLVIATLWLRVIGRDFGPAAITMAVLILILAIVFRRGLRWPVLDFILGLVAAEFITLCFIGYFSGYSGLQLFDRFNLRSLAVMSLFVGLPWLVGLGIGSVWSRISERLSLEK